MSRGKYDPIGESKEIIRLANVTINCQKKKKEKTSAFRAVNNTADQSVSADVLLVPVLYPNVIFDLNNEYDPASSTFTPKQAGVYSIIASVNFIPFEVVNYRAVIFIEINGNPVVADNDFFGEIAIGNVISVSAILQLKAGDKVKVAAQSSTNGTFIANPPGMHFEAARFPSPLTNHPKSAELTLPPDIIHSKKV